MIKRGLAMNTNELMSRAMHFYKREDLEKALHFLNKILTEDPNHAEAKEFLKKVKKRISLEPYINHFLEYSSKLYKEGRFKDAIEQAQKALSTDPESNKARTFIEKLKNESNNTKGIEPFAEESFANDIDSSDIDSPFVFDEDEDNIETGKNDISEEIKEQASVFDQPFTFDMPEDQDSSSEKSSDLKTNDENETTSKDDFVFTIDSEDSKSKEEVFLEEQSEESPIVVDPIHRDASDENLFSFEEAESSREEQSVFEDTGPEKYSPEFNSEEEIKNSSDTPDQTLSNEDFDFETSGPADTEEVFKVDTHKPEENSDTQDFGEKDLFDFDSDTDHSNKDDQADIDFEEAEIGFFTQAEKETEASDLSSSAPQKSHSSESLLNEFQKGLGIYKELNLKEALDIFTNILAYEKEFKNELPDLFEESRQLFLEIKAKLKDSESPKSEENPEPESDDFEEMLVKTQINIKKKSQISNTKKYTFIGIFILAILFGGFLLTNFLSSSDDEAYQDSAQLDPEQEREAMRLQREEEINEVLSEANKLFNKGDSDTALNLVEDIIEMEPDNIQAINLQNRIMLAEYLSIGEEAYISQNYRKAYENFQNAFNINPEIPDLEEKLNKSKKNYEGNTALYQSMDRYYQTKERGEIHRAYNIINTIRRDYPDHKFVKSEYDSISAEKKAIDEQIRQEQIQQYMSSARNFFNNGIYNLAIADYRKALELDPKNDEIRQMLYKSFYNTGINALQRRRRDTAYWAFTEALRLYPEDKDAQELLDWTFKNLEEITSPDYNRFVNSLITKE